LLRIHALTVADIPAGMHLKKQAGWNQLEADWQRLLDLQPDGCFLAELDGARAGTVTTCRFGPVAWVAMLLVDPVFRRRGIGRALMCHALDALDTRGVLSVRLDATPMGRPLYESLGFASEHAHGARRRQARRVLDGATGSAGATDRPLSRGGTRGSSAVRGRAAHVCGGRCVHRHSDGSRKASAQAKSWGLTPGRLLTRMGRGTRVEEDLERIWASAGPEKG
jgi:GNAT superfamily N-acetyltransferase